MIHPISTQRMGLRTSQLKQVQEMCMVFLEGSAACSMAAPAPLPSRCLQCCPGADAWRPHLVRVFSACSATLLVPKENAGRPAVPQPTSPLLSPGDHPRFCCAFPCVHCTAARGAEASPVALLFPKRPAPEPPLPGRVPLGGAGAWPRSSCHRPGLLAGMSSLKIFSC